MRYFLLIFTIVALFGCGGTGGGAAVAPTPSTDANLAGFNEEQMAGSDATYVYKAAGDGRLLESGYTVNGKKNGTWMTYHEDNERIQTLASWVDGQLNGPSLTFNNRGQIEKKSDYKAGIYDGIVATYKFGRLEKSTPYVAGKMEGTYEEYNQKGKLLKQIEFKNGVQDGNLKYFDDEGNVTLEYIYKNGEKVSGGIVK